ncbi:hypothetical protein VIBHAR_03335 [Vibrio campbellii ATCC BAA-1116]|uniref:Uncharacterized protein n=1 Tax=Vibrio campbellii (strain ATCC BAA-1116) TaxID=2902295 RepID=A7MZJ8_VIBC1|nr:hypothetical protein VIBHAR_03335 [Vibrio campbellii ATCC BAA-1116]
MLFLYPDHILLTNHVLKRDRVKVKRFHQFILVKLLLTSFPDNS